MKSIDRRLGKLEDKLGIATNRPRVVVIVSDLVGRGLDDDTCLQILREGGFPPANAVSTVDLCEIPVGLSAKETERFIRENGAKICGIGSAQSQGSTVNGESVPRRQRSGSLRIVVEDGGGAR
jgi:hypothetical protein